MDTNFKYDDFEIDYKKRLGKGQFGCVYKAIEKNTGNVYAIKRIEDLNEEEINNMKLMNNCEN